MSNTLLLCVYLFLHLLHRTLFSFTFRYIDYVISLNNSKALYELFNYRIKDTTHTASSASYLTYKYDIEKGVIRQK
jgi:hypothetical protein